jgi:hypothetical protein
MTPPEGFVLRMTPVHVGGVGPWTRQPWVDTTPVRGQPQLAWVGHCFLRSDNSVPTAPLTVRLAG